MTNPTFPVHVVKASSFADPADVRAFRKAKAAGKTDQEAFRVGDNGVGLWGDDCSEGSGPACALPPDFWHTFLHPRGTKILVHGNGRSVVCQLKDTMPQLKHITNGAGIDLNPDAVAALGEKPPLMMPVSWQVIV